MLSEDLNLRIEILGFFKRFKNQIQLFTFIRWAVSAPKNPTGKKYKIINFSPVNEEVNIYR